MKVTMVVPCFNEQARWDREYWRRMLTLSDTQWIFVDDGSTDGTLTLLNDLAGSGAQVLRLPTNRGKAEAVRQGMLAALNSSAAQDECVGFIDADGAFTQNDVARMMACFDILLKKGDQIDAVWSARVALAGRDIQRSTTRHYLGRIVATFLSVGADLGPYDTQSGLKLFRSASALTACLADPFRTRWLFEVELIARWLPVNGRPIVIWEEPLQEWREIAGSKVTFSETYRIARELVAVKRLQQLGSRAQRTEN